MGKKIKLELDVSDLTESDRLAITSSLSVLVYRLALRFETLTRRSDSETGRKKLSLRQRIAAINDVRSQLSSAVSQIAAIQEGNRQ